MWSLCVLCVLCVLLSPVQGQDLGGSNHTDVFSRTGSNVLLPPRYNLTIDKNNKSCDQFIWLYESIRISRSKSCDLTEYNYPQFSNYKTSEDGHLTLSNVTRNNSGNYTVTVEKRKGSKDQEFWEKVFSDHYNLRVQGQDRGGNDQKDVSYPPGSDVLLPLRYNLTIDKDNKSCDVFTWTYELIRISLSSSCNLTDYYYPQFPNYKTSEDGHLTLTNVTRNNSGNYTVTVQKAGETSPQYYILRVQDPVSEPLLNVSCLPDGGSNISCRTNTGTDPCFSLTVNGALLLNSTSSRTMGDVSEVSVPVALSGPWNITCSVRNRVSENETWITERKCPVPPSDPVLEGWCLHDGSRDVSCSVVNGSDLVFSLSENGELLENARKEQKRVNVTLSSSGPWTVHCSVRNNLGEKNNMMTFQACPVPPSDPVLKVSCLQDGSSEIACSVEKGTDLVFSLSANGETLKNVTKQEKRVNVTLSSSGPWDVHCSVRNDHGEKNETETFKACPVPVSVPIINVSCHHDGSARGVCWVEDGTNVSYTWTVSGKIIVQNTSPDLIIHASQFTSGAINISCSAENSISKKQSNVTNIYCGDSCWTCLRNSIIGGAVALIVTTSALVIASFYIGHNKKAE